MTTLGLDRRPDRCPDGFASVMHPDLCRCDHAPDEWQTFVRALRKVAAEHNGTVDWTHVRPHLRGRIAHKRIGSFTKRAKSLGLLTLLKHDVSKDDLGKNAGRLEPVYMWRGTAA